MPFKIPTTPNKGNTETLKFSLQKLEMKVGSGAQKHSDKVYKILELVATFTEKSLNDLRMGAIQASLARSL